GARPVGLGYQFEYGRPPFCSGRQVRYSVLISRLRKPTLRRYSSMRYPWARCSDTASRTYGIRMSRGDHAVCGDESAAASVEGGGGVVSSGGGVAGAGRRRGIAC